MARFTLGIEEEFQIVDSQTGQLAPLIHQLLEKTTPILGDSIKAEMLQSCIELCTDVCPNITTLRLDLQDKTARLAQILEEHGATLVRAGTNPTAYWQEQQRTINDRYIVLENEYQDVGRSILIFGLHIHVGLGNHELAIPLINQLRTWLPHLLALSSNSPFWLGRNSGLKSYRAIVWKRFPRSGIPDIFSSTREFEHYVNNLVQNGCIDNAKRIWWDIRAHPIFDTIEFRIFDMPATLEDSIRLAALCQALVAKLYRLYQQGLQTPVLPTHYIEENKWRAARYGLDAEIVDFNLNRTISMRESIHEMLDFVEDVIDDLGISQEINAIRDHIDSHEGTGADQQIAVYREHQDALQVTRYLMAKSREGLILNPA